MLFGFLCVGARNRVGSALSLQIRHGVDVGSVAVHDHDHAVVRVGVGEVVHLGALGRHVDAVDHEVVPSGVKTSQKPVPLALDEFGLHADFLGNLAAHFHVVTRQNPLFIMIGPGRPGALHGDHDLAARADVGKPIRTRPLVVGSIVGAPS